MGYSINSNYSQFCMPPFGFYGQFSATKNETEEEKQERLKKEEAEKAAAEFKKRMEMIRANEIIAKKANSETPLTEGERQLLKKEGLKFEEDEIKKSEGSLAANMLFTSPFLIPTIKTAINGKKYKNEIQMFYKDSAAHMDLFTKNPDLMINAQESIQKLERKYIKDLKAVKGNISKTKSIISERNFFREVMQDALNSNKPQEIAKATEQCKTASAIKNGLFTRLYRSIKKQPKIISRFDTVVAAESAGKFSSIKPPKEGASFFRNLFSNKLTWIITAGMAAIPVLLDFKNIQKAKAIDNENKQKNKNTNYEEMQITQTGIKSAASAITYTLMDTGARTLTKKFLGKFASKLAAQIALKGGCKLLGSAIGSVVPGIGTALGLILGTAADFALNKYVFGKLDLFKNTIVKKAELESGSDEKLISEITDQYSMGNDIHDKKILAILEKKCGSENFKGLKKLHNMSESERNKHLTSNTAQTA